MGWLGSTIWVFFLLKEVAMMIIHAAELVFSIPGAQSLKDKRQVSRSLIERAKKRFNAAIAEVGAQDRHQTLILGVAVVSSEASHARDMLEAIIRFMESSPEAELISVQDA